MIPLLILQVVCGGAFGMLLGKLGDLYLSARKWGGK